MEDWQARVVREKKELDEKIERLSIFLGTREFQALNSVDRALLESQLRFMTEYTNILGHRISRFGRKDL